MSEALSTRTHFFFETATDKLDDSGTADVAPPDDCHDWEPVGYVKGSILWRAPKEGGPATTASDLGQLMAVAIAATRMATSGGAECLNPADVEQLGAAIAGLRPELAAAIDAVAFP